MPVCFLHSDVQACFRAPEFPAASRRRKVHNLRQKDTKQYPSRCRMVTSGEKQTSKTVGRASVGNGRTRSEPGQASPSGSSIIFPRDKRLLLAPRMIAGSKSSIYKLQNATRLRFVHSFKVNPPPPLTLSVGSFPSSCRLTQS